MHLLFFQYNSVARMFMMKSGLPIFASLGIPLFTIAEIPKPPDSYREGLVSSVYHQVQKTGKYS